MAVKSPGVLTMSGRPTARNALAPSVPAVSSLARDRRSGMVAPAAVWRDFALRDRRGCGRRGHTLWLEMLHSKPFSLRSTSRDVRYPASPFRRRVLHSA